jgi:hypothetical protein
LLVCSRKHHHALKRQLTPAELKMARTLQPYCCAVISSDGKTFNARRRPGCCVLHSVASGTGCCTRRLPMHAMEYLAHAHVKSQCPQCWELELR